MSETTRRSTKRTPAGGADAAPATNRRRPDTASSATPVAEARNGSRSAPPPKNGSRTAAHGAGNDGGHVLDREERIRMTAYFLAEQDGFRGEPESYWLAAERAVAESTTR
jgi:hypothetical protein